MGKTFFREKLRQVSIRNGCTFDQVSSEDIRGELIKTHLEKGKTRS
jgi:hypothetical protein